MELQTDVALALTKQVLLSMEARYCNAVISPVSIHVVLSLIAAGSNGATRDQLLSFLKAESVGHLNFLAFQLVSLLTDGGGGGPTLSFVNGVWVDKSISVRHSFKQVARNFYKATSHPVDFQNRVAEAANGINEWSNGLINNVLPANAVNSLTRIVLANAMIHSTNISTL